MVINKLNRPLATVSACYIQAMYHIWEVCPAEVISPQGRPFNISLEWLNVKPLDIKAMMAMIKDEPEDKYIPVLKPVLLQALTEIKQLRRKNSQLGGKVARLRRENSVIKESIIK